MLLILVIADAQKARRQLFAYSPVVDDGHCAKQAEKLINEISPIENHDFNQNFKALFDDALPSALTVGRRSLHNDNVDRGSYA